jgi:hypothetical protein
MPLDTELCPSRQEPNQAVHPTIGELDDHAATAAHEMVAVPLGRPRVMTMAVIHVDVFDQIEPRQEVHGAVHAGKADAAVDPECAPVNLGDLEVLRGVRQDLENGHTTPGELHASVLQCLGNTLCAHGLDPQMRNILKQPIKRHEERQARDSSSVRVDAKNEGSISGRPGCR